MNQYIITDEGIKGILDYFAEEDNDELRFAAYDIINAVKSNPYDPQPDRDKVLDELGKILNTRIAKMEILDSKNPSQFRKGIIEAYRDIEKWEMAQHRQKAGEQDV
jgi:hypothetical protein